MTLFRLKERACRQQLLAFGVLCLFVTLMAGVWYGEEESWPVSGVRYLGTCGQVV